MKSRFLKSTSIIIISISTIYLILLSITSYLRYPNPIQLSQMVLISERNPSALPSYMSYHQVPIDNNNQNLLIPYTKNQEEINTVSWKGKTVPFQTFLSESRTRAFILIRNNQITHEWYDSAYGKEYLFPTQSISKVMTSLVVGKLIDQKIINEDELLVHYFPEWLTGTNFDTITIRHLLDMQSGIDVPEDYPDTLLGYLSPVVRMYSTTDHNHFITTNRKMSFSPGSKIEYRSIDTQILGMVASKITGNTISDLFADFFWKPIGAEYPALWLVDKVGGTEKAFSGFVCTAKDLARIGLLIANEGMLGADRLISERWIERLASPVKMENYDDWGYSAQMWHPADNIQLGLGVSGQHMYINASKDIVIIKLAEASTYEDDEKWEFDVLHEIANIYQ